MNDFLEDKLKQTDIDILNLGFESSLGVLSSKKQLLADDALILAPISDDEQGSLEQSY